MTTNHFRGKPLEDYNFSPQASRLIIMAGVPLANRTELFHQLKMNHVKRRYNIDYSGVKDNEWYQEDAARHTNIVSNWAISDKADFGAILLVKY